jgi:hypothetical protein
VTRAPYIMALDISKSNTGVAMGRAGDAPTILSIRSNGPTEDHIAMKRLGTWLLETIKLQRPDVIVFEAPLQVIPGEWDHEAQRVKAKGNPQTTITLAKMVGVVEFICAMKNITAQTAHVDSVRKAFIGHGRPENPKERARAMCEVLGWSVNNLDQADAAAVFYWATTKHAPRHYTPITPMMQAKAATLCEARA